MGWYFLDKVIRSAATLVIITICLFFDLEDGYSEFVVILSFYFIGLAVSSLGIDSLIYQRIHNSSFTFSELKVLLVSRFTASLLCSLTLFIYLGCTVGWGSPIVYAFCVAILIRCQDVFEYAVVATGDDARIQLSKSMVIINVTMLTLKVTCVYLYGYVLLSYAYVVESLISGLVFIYYFKKYVRISAGAAISTYADLFRFCINSSLTIFYTRADQLFGVAFLDPLKAALYFTLVRYFEPLLTFGQIYYSYYYSKRTTDKTIKGIQRNYLATAMLVLVYSISLWLFLYLVEMSEADLFLALVFIYLLNLLRVLSGKEMVRQNMSLELVLRTILGLVVLLSLYYILAGGFQEFIYSFIVSLFVVQIYSVQLIWKNK